MSAKHYLHVASQIPRHIHPTEVIAALHNHETALTLQALTCGHEKAPSTAPETLKDTYWYPPDQYPITTYTVTECITWCPGIGEYGKKYIKFPSCFQDTRQGIKTRADAAAGVTVRAEFRVVAGGEAGSEVAGEGMGIGDAAWVLVEDVEVSCSWWLMPFVKGKMEEAHRDVCRKVIERVEQQRNRLSLPKPFEGIKRQDSKADSMEDLNTGFAQETREHYAKNKGGLSGKNVGPSSSSSSAVPAIEVEAVDSQRIEMPATPLPQKITYR